MSLATGLGKYAVGKDVRQDWVIYGLGSCIGLILCDRWEGVLGMAHIVLPASPEPDPPEPARYADTAVPFLLQEMERLRAIPNRIVAFPAGGTRMVEINGAVGAIARRNLEAVREELAMRRIRVGGESVGGTFGRTLRWNAAEGLAIVSRFGAADEVLTPVPCRPVQPGGGQA